MVDYINFDKSTFAILLEKAKCDHSIKKYANISDVSAAHISRLLRKLISTLRHQTQYINYQVLPHAVSRIVTL